MPSPDTRVLTAHVPTELASRVDALAERLTLEALEEDDAGPASPTSGSTSGRTA